MKRLEGENTITQQQIQTILQAKQDNKKVYLKMTRGKWVVRAE